MDTKPKNTSTDSVITIVLWSFSVWVSASDPFPLKLRSNAKALNSDARWGCVTIEQCAVRACICVSLFAAEKRQWFVNCRRFARTKRHERWHIRNSTHYYYYLLAMAWHATEHGTGRLSCCRNCKLYLFMFSGALAETLSLRVNVKM